MTLEELREHDLVEYTARNDKGVEIFVTTAPLTLGKIIEKNNLKQAVGGVTYQDAVNTCPSCGVLYYIEDLIQLEDDIICEKCNRENNIREIVVTEEIFSEIERIEASEDDCTSRVDNGDGTETLLWTLPYAVDEDTEGYFNYVMIWIGKDLDWHSGKWLYSVSVGDAVDVLPIG